MITIIIATIKRLAGRYHCIIQITDGRYRMWGLTHIKLYDQNMNERDSLLLRSSLNKSDTLPMVASILNY